MNLRKTGDEHPPPQEPHFAYRQIRIRFNDGVQTPILGRTNRAWPGIWLQLSPPTDRESTADFLAAAVQAGVPLDVSVQPAYFGGQLRSDEYVSIVRGTLDYSRATDHDHAVHLVQAHLLESLSGLGRTVIDFYFLRVRDAVEEYQIAGAMEALEVARQDGHIRYLGILAEGPALATLGVWQFHDGFDVILIGDDNAKQTLAPLALERRVGVIADVSFVDAEIYPRILSVSSVEEVRSIREKTGPA